MRRPAAAAALLVTGGVLVGLTIAEISLRYAGRGAWGKRVYLVADPVLHHRLEPGTRVKAGKVEYVVNSLGLRDREYSQKKPDNTFRILMLGDSFTEGFGLPIELTVAKQVERMLNDGRCQTAHEVINAGLRSYSPIVEYLALKRLSPLLSPDLVLLNFDMTDVHDDWLRTRVATLDAEGLPLAVPANRVAEDAIVMPHLALRGPLWLLTPFERVMHHSAIYQLFRKSKLGESVLGDPRLTPERLEELHLVGDIRYDALCITRDVDSPEIEEGWALTQRYLACINRSARAAGATFAIVVYPHSHQVSADESPVGRRQLAMGPGFFPSERPFKILEEFGRREGVPVINLLALFRARHESDGPLFRVNDMHHNPNGARVFAEGIMGGLEENRLLPHCVNSAPGHPGT